VRRPRARRLLFLKLALAGDTMLGRGVAERLADDPAHELFAPEVVAAVREGDLVVLNLECCISERGEPAPRRVFHFRAPPVAAERLAELGVDCVTLANNHALDFGPEALLDTLAYLDAAGIAHVGAGADVAEARAPVVLDENGFRLAVRALTDHPVEYAAGLGCDSGSTPSAAKARSRFWTCCWVSRWCCRRFCLSCGSFAFSAVSSSVPRMVSSIVSAAPSLWTNSSRGLSILAM